LAGDRMALVLVIWIGLIWFGWIAIALPGL
jgi:hypothetical protein